MALRNIVKDTDPLLRKKSREVEQFDGKLAQLLDDMWDTLNKAEGLGLAAPQVGVLKRVFIVDYDDEQFEVINPQIVASSGQCDGNEGCLSVEGYRGIVPRPQHIKLKFFDRHGKKYTLEAQDYFARVFLHEYDHLDGILFSDRMTSKISDSE